MGTAYQIAVDLGFKINENILEYQKYLAKLDTENPHILSVGSRLKGEYDESTHQFYLANSKEDAEIFIKKLEEKSLAKKTHIDEF